MKVKHLFTSLLIVSIFTFVPTLLNAQFDDPDPVPPTSAPFDGGLSLMIAAGVAYAAKRGYDVKRKGVIK